MDALTWVVVIITLVRQLVMAAGDIGHLQHTRILQAQGFSGLATDTQALLSFKQTIESDPNGVLDEWNLQFSSNSCDWFGITCANARVVALNLGGCGLVAPLPLAALAPLDQLQEVRLSNNSFYSNGTGISGTDQILFSAGGCNSLTTLDLSSNNLNISFSNLFLQNCTSLTYLNISRNALHDSLPSGVLGDASSLRWLDLSHNNFSGVLSPDIFLRCGALSWLDLSTNSLSGSLPSGISQCTSLQHLDLSFNHFNGTLPADTFPPSSSPTSSLNYLQLSSNNISGIIPPIASCANLSLFDVSENLLTGQLPASLGACTGLRVLNLSINAFTGNLPTFITSLVNLEVLSISGNNLTGTIWPEIGNFLVALQELHLADNELVGTIPSSLSNCTALHTLDVSDNSLSGVFPVEVVNRIASLSTLVMSYNYFTGTLPSSLSNASSLSVLDLSANSFTGGIPSTICSPSLSKLLLADNELSGVMPLGSCTKLVVIDVSCNFINSTFPKPLPILPYLQDFIMWANLIQEEIPSDICSAAARLRLLILNVNLVNGTIPPTLANCSYLEWLSLSGNLLTGSIPLELGLMPRINFLHLNNNSLSGTIPPSLGDCRYLVWVDLSSNELEGAIPPELAKQAGKVIKGSLNTSLHLAFFKYLLGDPCTRCGLGSVLIMAGVRPARVYRIPSFRSCNRTRLYLDIVPYYFPGPPGSSQGGSYTYLDLAHNRLSGTIPQELGAMTYLTVLSLSYNELTGNIPFSLANLIRCSILHLDHNHLQGPIPPGLSNLGIMNQLDFSNNNLSGSIPDTGKLPTFPESSFANNPYLCGTPLPDCARPSSISNDWNVVAGMGSSGMLSRNDIIMIVVIPLSACLLLGLVQYVRIRCCHMREQQRENLEDSHASGSQHMGSPDNPLSINVATFEKCLHKLTYQHLWAATDGFSAEKMIGRGGFGDVYKATFGDGAIVAIKKLVHPLSEGNREFTAEMETIGKIKHRNLVPLLGYCKMGEERLLVYEYMEGGSLDRWLHGSMHQQDTDGPRELSWDRRKRVAIGTAKGLCFLHNDCIPHIIHRDLKSGNVLLDDAFEARVCDFGMARLVSASETHTSVSTQAGTPGYVPPEYCQSFRCTKQGDVYSYGVVLLELITGRRPTWSYSVYPATPRARPSVTNTGGNDDDNAATQVVEEREEGGVDLVGWVKRHITEGNARAVLDERALYGGHSMMGTIDLESREREMLAYLGVAYRCVNDRPVYRPSMRDVMASFKEIHHGQDLDLIQ